MEDGRLTKAQAASLFRNGDAGSVEKLWLHGMRFVNKIVGKLDKLGMVVDAEEAKQVGYLAIGEALESWDPSKSSFGTYIWIRARGEVLNSEAIAKRKGMTGDVNADTGSFIDSDEVSEEEFGFGPDTGFAAVEAEELRSFIARRLSATERQVIELIYFQGLPQAEAGRYLQIDRRNVGTLHKSALAKLGSAYN